MKNLKIWIIVIFVLGIGGVAMFLLMGSGDTPEPDSEPIVEREQGRDGEALIWRVESDTAVVYLVGTIHIGKEGLLPMQQILLDAFYDSDAIAVEFDIVAFSQDLVAQVELAQRMIYSEGTIQNHISQELYDLLLLVLDELGIVGLERTAMLATRADLVAMTLVQRHMAEWGFMDHPGVDEFFINLAKRYNMPIIELESAVSQINLGLNFSRALNELLLKSILFATPEELEETRLMTEKMYTAWLNGDVELLRQMIEQENSMIIEHDPILFKEYNDAMMVKRDIAMVATIREMLQGNQTIFFAVGAAHLVANGAIIDQLEELGYTATRITQ